MKRLLKYLKPHVLTMVIVSVMVLLITVVELYKPIIIGNAIDYYINGYYNPYAIVDEEAAGAIRYGDVYISKNYDAASYDGPFYQMFLYNDRYYMAENITADECELLKEAGPEVLSGYVDGARCLSRDELKDLRHFDFTGICHAALLYLGALLAGFVLNALQTYLLQKLGQDIIYKTREELFAHIHSLSLSFFNTQPVGKLVTRVTNDTEAVNEMFSGVLVRLFKNIVKIIGYAVVMLSINVKLAGYSFLLLPVIGVLTFVFRHLSRQAYRITRNKITDINTFLSENISGMKLIQIFTREKEKYDQFEEKSMGLFKAGFREVMIFAIFRPVIYFLSIVALVIIIGRGGSLVLGGAISIGTLYIFINYISSFFDPIQELAEQFGTLQSSLASAEKMFQILDVKPEIVNPSHPVDVKVDGKIEFKNVWFAYKEGEWILKDVSFHIKPKQVVAFVGATGAGKTTILQLIVRNYDIQKGQILIDGIDIRDIDIKCLRRGIGQMLQDVFLFAGSIKSNINLRDDSIPDADIVEACKYVNADQFIDKLPKGLDEEVLEGGNNFSSGQRQLLSFARTVVHHPQILILDEATANIDTETEKIIQDSLLKMMNIGTMLIVAHRLSTIQHADNIICLQKGQIIEQGNHQDLLKQKGYYYNLYRLQYEDQEITNEN